jgi:hypothetical protein
MSDAPQEFENLQKLLKLKRHESPPPGYFNNFSSLVVNHLEREARQRSKIKNSRLLKCLSFLETNPMTAGLFGVGVCGLLAVGITFSQERGSSDYSAAGKVTIDISDNALDGSLSGLNKGSRSSFVSASLDPVFSSNFTGSSSSGFDRLAFQPLNLSIGQ